MNILFTVVIVVQVLSALTIIGLVLLQHGKGADMGAAFGSGASGSLFGASGSSNFLSKSTGVAATIFFCATLALAYIGNKPGAVKGGVMENLPTAPASTNTVPAPAQPAQGAAPAPAPAAGAPAPVAPANQIPK
ncbi:preprotein translocase subunit SecG [Janthinobacterium sp. 17J80-10]|uniref:preprotein translocase subunit SecG n=1 Tax=Janthinobacterium sp. 17J80-10 TaxID=2497863 RepID=UPI0010058236|nr:preprotein translocase subunit SecG [Janthinobacterium sp. 17J80-10]QAU34708.1 preprotein translocase subunit SecG [Janthinobacterium sp. 17J80-10]